MRPIYFCDELLITAKEYVAIALGVLTLLAASAAVYEILTVNTQIQAKPEQPQVQNYSSEIKSFKSQIDSINSQISSMSDNLSALNILKNNLIDIRAKLIDLQNKNDQLQTASTQPALAVVLDKSSYFPGDTIKIAATGATPLKVVKVQLLDDSGFLVSTSQTWADSAGKIMYNMQLSGALLPGNYQVKLLSGQDVESQAIIIQTTGTIYNSSTGVYSFTAQTDKSVYQTSDLIEVMGKGQPNTSVSGVLTSPTGKTYTANTTIQPDGTFYMFYSTSQPYETGSWHITLTNLGQTKVIYTSITSSSNSYTLTAQTDKLTYQKGDTIEVSGTGTPYTTVTGVMTSPSGNTFSSSTTVLADGSYSMLFSTSQSYETGTWYIGVTNGAQNSIVSFYLQSPTTSYPFTAQTGRSIYHKGDTIVVSGVAAPNTTVDGVMTSQSGNTYSSHATARPDGSYSVFFSTTSSYEAGNWYITMTNVGRSTVVYFYMEPSG